MKAKIAILVGVLGFIGVVLIGLGVIKYHEKNNEYQIYALTKPINEVKPKVDELDSTKEITKSNEVTVIEEEYLQTPMGEICSKLQNYAKGLGSTIQCGIITLSEEEMVIIRNFLKSKEPEDGETIFRWQGGFYSWNSDIILGYEYDKGINIMGIGIWDYQGYKFVLHCYRNLLYIDVSTKKIIAIVNPVDYPSDDGYSQFENLLWGNAPSEREEKLCTLQTTSECCLTYIETEKEIRIEKWLFGEKLHTWYGEKLKEFNFWSGVAPSAVDLKGQSNDIHFIVAKGNLFSFQEGEDKINVIAEEITSPDDVVTAYFSKNTVYYACGSEVHMVCTATLEDVLLAEDFGNELQITGGISGYVIYHDKSERTQVVPGYFDENNQAVMSKKETLEQAQKYEKMVMESLALNIYW